MSGIVADNNNNNNKRPRATEDQGRLNNNNVATEFELKKALKLFAEFKVTFLEDGDKQLEYINDEWKWFIFEGKKGVKRILNPNKGVIKEVTQELTFNNNKKKKNIPS